MKEVAPHDRPREKLERLGAVGARRQRAAGARARQRLARTRRAGAGQRAARAVRRAARPDASRAADLRRVPGVGGARAAQVLAAVELGRRTLVRDARRPAAAEHAAAAGVATCCRSTARGPSSSSASCMLDTKHRLIRIKLVSIGSLDSTVVHPREVFREAIAGIAPRRSCCSTTIRPAIRRRAPTTSR